jgi:hypothetical protein
MHHFEILLEFDFGFDSMGRQSQMVKTLSKIILSRYIIQEEYM